MKLRSLLLFVTTSILLSGCFVTHHYGNVVTKPTQSDLFQDNILDKERKKTLYVKFYHNKYRPGEERVKELSLSKLWGSGCLSVQYGSFTNCSEEGFIEREYNIINYITLPVSWYGWLVGKMLGMPKGRIRGFYYGDVVTEDKLTRVGTRLIALVEKEFNDALSSAKKLKRYIKKYPGLKLDHNKFITNKLFLLSEQE